MANLLKSAAYLQGLISGTDFAVSDEKTKAVWENLLNYCSEIAEAYEGLENRLRAMEDYVHSLDEDLSQLEDDFYQCEYMDGGKEDEDSTFYEVNCPNCRENLCIEEMVLNGRNVEVLCPTCGETIYVVDKKGIEPAAMVKSPPESLQ